MTDLEFEKVTWVLLKASRFHRVVNFFEKEKKAAQDPNAIKGIDAILQWAIDQEVDLLMRLEGLGYVMAACQDLVAVLAGMACGEGGQPTEDQWEEVRQKIRGLPKEQQS